MFQTSMATENIIYTSPDVFDKPRSSLREGISNVGNEKNMIFFSFKLFSMFWQMTFLLFLLDQTSKLTLKKPIDSDKIVISNESEFAAHIKEKDLE